MARNRITNTATVVWYQALLNRYNSAQSANNSIDSKTGVVIAGGIAILIYLAQVTPAPRILAIGGAILLVVSIVLCIISIHVRDVATEVHSTIQKPDYYDSDDETLYWHLIADLEDSIGKLEEINKSKGSLYVWSIYCFLGGSAFAILSLYIKFTFGNPGWA